MKHTIFTLSILLSAVVNAYAADAESTPAVQHYEVTVNSGAAAVMRGTLTAVAGRTTDLRLADDVEYASECIPFTHPLQIKKSDLTTGKIVEVTPAADANSDVVAVKWEFKDLSAMGKAHTEGDCEIDLPSVSQHTGSQSLVLHPGEEFVSSIGPYEIALRRLD